MYILNVVEKGILPYVSKQESAINAGESFFQVCVIIWCHHCHATCICTLRISLVFTESRRCL